MANLVTWSEFSAGGRPQGGTIAELVLEEVTNLSSRRRPLMSTIGRTSVSNTYVEWLVDTLGSRGLNAVLEGAAATNPALIQPTREFTHVQSFAKWGVVSDEQRAVRHYNEDPYVYQVRKSLNELMNDIEHALHVGTAATGATNAARQLSGLIDVFENQSGTLTFTDSSGTTFTEEVLVDLLQVFRDANLDVLPTQAYVGSYLKRTISEFSTKVTRNVDAAARRQELVIERHTSDFGDLDVMYAEDQPTAAAKGASGNAICFIDPSYFQVGWLKMPTVEQLSRDGLRDRFQINAHATLIFRNRKGGGGGKGYVGFINQAGV